MKPFTPTKTLADIVPEHRDKFEALLAQAEAWGMQPKLREVGRTCAKQQEYLAQGATAASLCRSAHVIGHAIDLDLYPNTCEAHTKLGEWWEQTYNGVWGGRWTHLFPGCGDMGHYHWLPDRAGAVPETICPKGVTLEQCEQIREDYLEKAFAWTPPKSKSGALLWGLGLGVVGFGAVWFWRKKR